MSFKLEGVFPPIPTPFDGDGNLLLDKFKANIALWNKTGLHGYVVLGSNGEAVMLTDSEKAALWEAARASHPARQALSRRSGRRIDAQLASRWPSAPRNSVQMQ